MKISKLSDLFKKVILAIFALALMAILLRPTASIHLQLGEHLFLSIEEPSEQIKPQPHSK
jgi:hypothetical protein